MIAVDGTVVQNNIKHIMAVHGYSQAFICEKTGIPSATISRYMTGKHAPNLEYIVKIAEAINTSVDYLLGLTASTVPGEKISPSMDALIKGYERSDAHTKKMTWMMLDPFLTDEEKALVAQQFDGPKSEAV